MHVKLFAAGSKIQRGRPWCQVSPFIGMEMIPWTHVPVNYAAEIRAMAIPSSRNALVFSSVRPSRARAVDSIELDDEPLCI